MIQKPRGTVDIFGEYGYFFEHIKSKLESLSRLYNFSKIETPIFEDYKLFCRDENDSSDIVNKEMYVFNDKSNRVLALRPEGTAPVIRSVIENKMLYKNPKPLKFFYFCPMFRYERPQSGRQRQFHQYGIEIISSDSIYDEIEAILFALKVLRELNIKKYLLKINYIGNSESRRKWNNDLMLYFKKHIDKLSETSKLRVEKNPMRILDDKDDCQKDFVINSPKIDKYLSKEEKENIKKFYEILDKNKINYEVDDKLVRGLDYYNGIVFEIVSTSDKLKGQSTMIGGGGYSNLFTELGEKEPVNCFGFAIGIERILIAFQEENNISYNKSIDIYIANLTDQLEYSINLLEELRNSNYIADSNFLLNKIDKHFKYANSFNPKLILIIGNKEISENFITVKDQSNNQETKIKKSELLSFVNEKIKKD